MHHRFVATPHDPNTAELGESFYAFFPRAWIGSFTSGFEMEEARTQTRKAAGKRAINPYYIYILGSFLCIVLVIALMGFWGLIAYLALALYAQMQLMLSDYVQHYGLARAPLGADSFEPVDARHSWDARAKLSSLWMMNAPRHSDHHAHPSRAYPRCAWGRSTQADRSCRAPCPSCNAGADAAPVAAGDGSAGEGAAQGAGPDRINRAVTESR